MKLLRKLIKSLLVNLFTPADPNLFGSRKRRKEKEKLAKEIKGYATDTQNEIDALKSMNPFESASAKSAMTQSARQAKQIGQRYANMMGGQASPEALIAAQSATQQAIGSTAGDIATGAEANKLAEINQLRSLQAGQLGQSIGMSQSAAEERGSGWTSFFQSLGDLGGAMEGAGSLMGGGK